MLPAFMSEAGLKYISIEEASVRAARQLARRILDEGLDPLAFSRDFEILWIRADYPISIQEVGTLDDQKATAVYIGQSETELREYARGLLHTLVVADGPTESSG
jgi:hypothetical protein